MTFGKRYEVLFYFCFSNVLLAWLLLERNLHLYAGKMQYKVRIR